RCRWLPGTTADLTGDGGSVTALHCFDGGVDPAGREEDEQQPVADVEHPLLARSQPRPLPYGTRLMPDRKKLVVRYECHAPDNLQCLCRGERRGDQGKMLQDTELRTLVLTRRPQRDRR